MIWQNPWAWLGLATLAVPVLIHLLGRRSARAQRFPTLRFIEASAPAATSLTRISDVPLLIVRMAILAAAVAALALPLLLTASRERSLGRSIARAIIVDTSASMAAATQARALAAGVSVPADSPGARTGITVARAEATRLAGDASTSVVIETQDPARALPGAVAWLARQPGRREVIIISDFQAGTIDSTDLVRIPADIGLALVPVRTEALTRLSPPTAAPSGDALSILVGEADRTRAAAARQAAAGLVGDIALPAGQAIALVFDGYPDRDALLRGARPLSEPWQGDVIARLRGDRALAGAVSAAAAPMPGGGPMPTDASTAALVPIARSADHRPVVLAGSDVEGQRARLLLFVHADAGSLVSAATFAAIGRAVAPAVSVAELDPTRIDDETLARWRRPAAAAVSRETADDAGESDGRWLWLAALLLLGAESWMRRNRRVGNTEEVVHERAA